MSKLLPAKRREVLAFMFLSHFVEKATLSERAKRCDWSSDEEKYGVSVRRLSNVGPVRFALANLQQLGRRIVADGVGPGGILEKQIIVLLDELDRCIEEELLLTLGGQVGAVLEDEEKADA